MAQTAPDRNSRGPLTLLLDGVLLFLALSGTVFSFSTAFSLEISARRVLAGCALAALVFLAVFSLPKFRWISLLLIGGGWGAALGLLWDTLVLGEISLRCSVVNTFVTSLGVGDLIGPVEQLPDAVWLSACTALVLAALVPLALLLGLSIVRLRSFWLTALITLPFLALPLAVTVTPAWPPLMAVLACWGALLLAALSERGGLRAYDRLRLTGLSVSALTLILLTLLLPRETYRRPAWADSANSRIVNWAVELSDRLFPGVNLMSGGLLPADQEVDLSKAGPLRFSGRRVLDVRTSLRGRIYLRGFSSAVYDSTGWHPLDEEAYLLHPQGGESEPGDAGMPGGLEPMNFPALAAHTDGQPYASVTVRNIGATPGYVYYPYHILTAPEELSGAQFVHDSYLAAEDGVESHTVYVLPESDPRSGAELPPAVWRTAQSQYEPFVRANYTQIPVQLDPVLRGWLTPVFLSPEDYLPEGENNEHYRAFFGFTSSVWSQADAYLHAAGLVADYLSVLAEYDPDTPATPEGEDFVGYFLTQSHRGYCMHFASAATLMLRALGVPARYVSGYVADIPASGRALVPDSNAHAWVEIYLSGYGWYPVEVTPIYAGGQPAVSGRTGVRATPAPTATPAPSQGPRPTAAVPTPTPTPQQALQQDGLPVFRWLGAAVLLLLLPVLRRRLAMLARKRRFSGPDPNRAVLAAYRYVQRLARRGGTIPEEVLDLARKAAFSRHILTEAERAAAVDAARQEALRLEQSLPPGKRALLRYFWALA